MQFVKTIKLINILSAKLDAMKLILWKIKCIGTGRSKFSFNN